MHLAAQGAGQALDMATIMRRQRRTELGVDAVLVERIGDQMAAEVLAIVGMLISAPN